jgi:hypothetical protein
MLEYSLGNGRSLFIYDFHEALTRAGVNESDHEICKDTALEDLFKDRKVKHLTYDLKTYSAQLEIAVGEGVEVLILHKESK